jgi:hypothetical protein
VEREATGIEDTKSEEDAVTAAEVSEEDIRDELYEQFDVGRRARVGIKYIIPILEIFIDTESRYDIDTRSKILAEIALFQAYEREPKFKIFVWATVLIGVFDFLHSLDPVIYGVLFIALATINGFVSSLHSPATMVAELEGLKDENGMPADYRAQAFRSVNTNVTLALFVIAVGVQLLVTSSIVQGELIARNVADGMWHPAISVLVLTPIPVVLNRIRGSNDED